jgi:hypothetical protein
MILSPKDPEENPGTSSHRQVKKVLFNRREYEIPCAQLENLCEIKYCHEEFAIDKAYDKDLREKKNLFSKYTKTKKSLFLTLITPYGINTNSSYCNTVDVTLTLDALFED